VVCNVEKLVKMLVMCKKHGALELAPNINGAL